MATQTNWNIDLNIAQSDMSSPVVRGRSMVRVHLFKLDIVSRRRVEVKLFNSLV